MCLPVFYQFYPCRIIYKFIAGQQMFASFGRPKVNQLHTAPFHLAIIILGGTAYQIGTRVITDTDAYCHRIHASLAYTLEL
ncbi:hypothetical protein OOU_Y34scaffold00525g1 [Pyricularia oryzae Y34]|uniref:Uncharacterized protein n=2 Tax=Pyricularia oryzae TaxID=318829 RepID=A0AA97PLA1_PYRO3|nr:hypothetical protein OOU_Y34scaffold00525g1 [Pyricularia oryzae Y34]